MPSGAGCNMARGAIWIVGFYNKEKKKKKKMVGGPPKNENQTGGWHYQPKTNKF